MLPLKHLPVLLCSFLLFLGSAGGEETRERDPVLLKVERSLRAALRDLELKPSFEYPKHSESLIVRYQTRKFMVHHGSMEGKYSEKAVEEEGPNYQGFLLRCHLQEAGTVNQACVPQTIRKPYWKTDLNVTIVTGTDKQLYWGLSYGNRPDHKLLKKIRDTVSALGKPEKGKQPEQSPKE